MSSPVREVRPTPFTWPHFRAGSLLVLTAAIFLVAFAPNQANAAGTGSISGTVTGGLGVSGTCVLTVTAYDSDGQQAGQFEAWDYVGDIPTDYKIENLEAGQYRLNFEQGCVRPAPLGGGTEHLGEYFNEKESLSDATPVSVTEGSETSGINVRLGQDVTISGTITGTDGTPLTGICVEAFDSTGKPSGAVAHTTGGHYDVNALSSGSYRLKFSDCLHPGDPSVITEFFDDKATLEEATPVMVGASGIDAQLQATPAPTVFKAAIGQVTVKGPAKAKKGKKAIFTVKISNSGNAGASGVDLGVKGKGVTAATSVGSIESGATKSVKVKLKPRKAGKVKLTFKVTSSNAGGKSVFRRITVKK